MNRNKPKYVSVRQDSFVFEGTNSRMIPSATASALRRLNSEKQQQETTTTSGSMTAAAAASAQTDDISAQIKINEITLFAQQNEETWTKCKYVYKSVELATYVLGLAITTLSFLYSVCLLFYSKLKSINQLFRLLNINHLIAHSALFYFIIELLSLVIYLTDMLRIMRVYMQRQF
jgi:hypothetical protein